MFNVFYRQSWLWWWRWYLGILSQENFTIVPGKHTIVQIWPQNSLAHSEVLGTSFFRLGPKIAILAGFMATLWFRRAPKNKKWTPPLLLALKTTILGQTIPLWGFGNIIFKIWPQNSHFGRIYGHFMGLYGQKAKNGPHHRVQREKLLYWSDLAHSRYLGSSKCVFKSPPPFGVQ